MGLPAGRTNNKNGRPFGAKGRRTELLERLQEAGFDLEGAIIHVASGECEFEWEHQLDYEVRAQRIDQARYKLLERIRPALRAVELKGAADAPVVLQFNVPAHAKPKNS